MDHYIKSLINIRKRADVEDSLKNKAEALLIEYKKVRILFLILSLVFGGVLEWLLASL
jgi:hypothetical protein